MIYRIKAPEILNATICLPASKSISNRALILNSLCRFPAEIKNISVCDDTIVTIKALRGDAHVVNVGAAGTAMRFLTAFLSLKNGERTITGTERMQNRPIRQLVDALRSIGARIDYAGKEGFPPLHIEGRALQGGSISLDGGVSSQYISALLMIAPLTAEGVRLRLTGAVVSRPYIRLTIALMRLFGVEVFDDGETLSVSPQPYTAVADFTVEPDWSAASYWYAMTALCKDAAAGITLPGLLSDSLQGDAAIAALFDRLGVKTSFTSSGVVLTKKSLTTSLLTFDFVSMPDIAQTAAVVCAMLGVPFRFNGLQSLKIKETDRLEALQRELGKLGYPLTVSGGDTLEWRGESSRPAALPVVATYEDHRMAMAFAPVAMRRPEGICIADPEVVSKSYPSYWDDLKKAGFAVARHESPIH
jgi:3-phosphoshikimate 1-carboxyvinyltransferase